MNVRYYSKIYYLFHEYFYYVSRYYLLHGLESFLQLLHEDHRENCSLELSEDRSFRRGQARVVWMSGFVHWVGRKFLFLNEYY